MKFTTKKLNYVEARIDATEIDIDTVEWVMETNGIENITLKIDYDNFIGNNPDIVIIGEEDLVNELIDLIEDTMYWNSLDD